MDRQGICGAGSGGRAAPGGSFGWNWVVIALVLGVAEMALARIWTMDI